VVQVPAAGRLMRERSAAALVEALQALLADYPARAAVRAYAEGFDWAATTRGQLALFRTILGDAPQAAAAGVAAPRTGGRHA
jgi:teichuronic acid biosynthesis glycosyltransferase TuaC